VRLGEKARAPGTVMTQAELQQELERFTGDFMTRMTDATDPLYEQVSPKDREDILRLVLTYDSSVLDIATDARPEVGLLDMIVFVGLARGVFERHWLPRFGPASHPILDVLRRSEQDLTKLVEKLASPAQVQRLRKLIDDWLAANPDRVRVAAVRFTEFSALVGRMSEEEAKEASGIFGAVRGATEVASEVALLGDRARFLAVRLPFVLRLQARLGVSEVTGDTIARLEHIAHTLEQLPEPGALVHDLTSLAAETRKTTEEARSTLAELQPLLAKLPPPAEIRELLATAERLNDKAVPLLDRVQQVLAQLDRLLPNDPASADKKLTAIETQADGFLRRAVLYLIGVGAAWSLLFWGCYLAAKLLLSRLRARRRRTRGGRRLVPHPA
jgi:uncharacterized protein Yka (UPF0111/DUF47 family)